MKGERRGEASPAVSVWDGLPRDPDLDRDLGYRIEDWEVVSARAAGAERLLFLPSDEAVLCDDEFIVADPRVVCDVADHR